MTEQIPPSSAPDIPPTQVTVDIQQLAKMMAEEAAKAAQDAIATLGLYKTRGEVVAKDADQHVQVRRETSLNDDGTAGDPDPGFYPVPSPGTLPQVGDTVWCVGNNGGLIVLGKEADAAYKDLPAVLAVANLALAEPPIGASMDWNGASDPASGKWLIEDGRLLDIAAYPDLYAVVGTASNIGGEAVTQFRIPDKRGRVSVGAGQGTGLTNRVRASKFGTETHTLLTAEMPSHSHTVSSVSSQADHTHGGTTNNTDLGHSHSIGNVVRSIDAGSERVGYPPSDGGAIVSDTFSWTHSDPGATSSSLGNHNHGFTTSAQGGHSHTVTLNSTGDGNSHPNMQPSLARHSIIRAKL